MIISLTPLRPPPLAGLNATSGAPPTAARTSLSRSSSIKTFPNDIRYLFHFPEPLRLDCPHTFSRVGVVLAQTFGENTSLHALVEPISFVSSLSSFLFLCFNFNMSSRIFCFYNLFKSILRLTDKIQILYKLYRHTF